MKKRYLILLGILFFKIDPISSQTVSFPYQNDLKGSSPADVVAVGPDQIFTNDGIQLTNGGLYKSGAIVLNDVSFNSEQGLTIEFEYDMYGGEPYPGLTYGDGLCLFLYDASAPLTNLPGYSAGALAYFYKRSNTDPHQGLNKAYLAVAMDQFGSFRGVGINNIGVSGSLNNGWSQVTLRGAMRHTPIGADAVTQDGVPTSNISSIPAIYNDARYQGYPVLFTRTTNDLGTNTLPKGKKLDMINNSEEHVDYIDIYDNLPANIEIRGGVANPLPSSAEYRKVIITLGPADPMLGGGYFITVDLRNGINSIRVLENFHYKENFFYSENSNFTSDADPHRDFKYYNLDASVPQEFKIGFGASTGGATQFHSIRNLVVDLAYTPRFEPDFKKFCGSFADIDVFNNDFVYNGPIYGPPSQGNNSEYIDYNSFMFTDSDVLPYNQLGSWNGDFLTYSVPNEGIWTFNKTTGKVRFTPFINFSGNAQIYYTAKGTASLGGPFNQDEYYAIPEKITVEDFKCGGVINPQLPSGGVKRSDNL